ncbi:MAG TPA: hypothetical protein VLA08_06965 [Nitrosopumilus sp.]|nr:hypothetical protein [Nitrosopumilus sp.]
MNTKEKELVKEAFEIAHKENHSYTYDEANKYDPLISTLYSLMYDDFTIDDKGFKIE